MEEHLDQGLDLRGYLRIILHRWWVIAICVVGTATLGYFYDQSKTPIYEARTRILVEGVFAPGSGAGESLANESIGRTYSDLITTQPILNQVASQVGLSGQWSVSADNSRSFIDIRATHTDAETAARIANTTAEVFIQDLRDRQFTQIAQFQASLAQYGVVQDPAIIASQTARLASLSIIEPASIPGAPADQGGTRVLFLSIVLGLLLAALVIVVLEQLRETAATAEEIKALTGFEILGSVIRYRSRTGEGPALVTGEPKESPAYESYNFLWTNLEFAALGKDDGLRTILVTSAGPSEGKSTTAINLAAVIAKDGKRVVIVDADLRRPSLHRGFAIKPERGLTNVLLKHATLEDVLSPVGQDGLQLVPCGPLPADPAQALRSSQFRNMIETLKERADVVVIDSPPVLVVADALAVAPLADAVLVVVDVQHTTRDALKRMAQSIRQAQPSVVGVVLNKVGGRGLFGYSYRQSYYYYNYHYSRGANGAKPGKWSWPLTGRLFKGRRTTKSGL
jgi:capsular exopolysaccharide synthesis family protein